jgi:3-isopropylmalate dehydratase small subunit
MPAGIDLPREYELSQTASSNEKSTDRQLSASGFQCSSKPPHEEAIQLERATFGCGSSRSTANDFAAAVEIAIILFVVVA